MMEDIEEPFRAAVRAGDVEAVSALLASEPRPPVNECYVGEGQTALMWAASEGNMALVRVLAESGEANIEARGPFDGPFMTPLCLASAKGHYDVVDYLLGRGAHFSAYDKNRRTPLIHSAISGHEAVVRRLLAADPHAVVRGAMDRSGMCALMHACKEGHANIARVLMIENGAAIRSVGFRRNPEAYLSTAECAAVVKEADECYAGLVESVREGDLAKVIQLLDQAPGLLQRNEPFKDRPLWRSAISKGHVDIVRHFICSGAKDGRKTEDIRAALVDACGAGKGEIVALLLAEGADAAVMVSERENALQLACQSDYWDIFTQLWRSITSRKTPYREAGSEALYYCYRIHRLDMVQMLVYDGMEFCDLLEDRYGDSPTAARADCFEFIKVVRENVEALGQACARGNLTGASELLRVHPYLLHMGAVGTKRTALMEAAANDRVDVLQMLLEHDTYTAASVVAICDPQKNKRGIFIPPIDFKDAEQHSALSLASASGFLGAVKLLLGKGADPCPFDPVDGSRFIMLDTADALRAACAGGNLPVVELLFQLSLYSEGMGRYFIAACSSGHEEVVRLVGSKLRPIEWGEALFEASQHGNVSLARLIMEGQPSDPNAAVHFLNKHFQMAGERGGGPMVKLFLEEGADVVVYSTLLPHISVLQDELARRKMLVNAAKEGDLTALKGLLGEEGDKKKVLRGRKGHGRVGTHSPLTAAAYHSEVEVAKYLVQRGAELDYADGSHSTPLMWAAQDVDLEMMHFLCEAGAQPWYSTWDDDESKETAMTLAVQHGGLEAVTALLSHAPTGSNGRVVEALKQACYGGTLALFRKLLSLCSLSVHSVVGCLDAAVCWDHLPVIMELLLIVMERTPRSITFDMIMEEAAAEDAETVSEPRDPRDRVSDEAYTMIELAVREDLYLLHKARTISDANSPQATPPPCLVSRAQPQHQPLPRVTVTVPAGITGGRPRDQGLEETRMEVLQVVVQFVVRDLKKDLYIELSHMLMPFKGW